MQRIVQQLQHSFPVFRLEAKQVQVLYEPGDFYRSVLQLSGNASKRVVISSLYLGTGKLEEELVNQLYLAQRRAEAKKTEFRLSLLFDYARSTRRDSKNRNSLSLLSRLLESNSTEADSVPRLRGKPGSSSALLSTDIRLFCTPALRGALLYLPERANEVIGVQHTKFAVFDDTVLLTGANLNDTYFTNRQDRYMRIDGAPLLANYFVDLFDSLAKFCFKARVAGTNESQVECHWDHALDLHPNRGHLESFRRAFRHEIQVFTQRWLNPAAQSNLAPIVTTDTKQTFLIPAVHFGLCGVDSERAIVEQLLTACLQAQDSKLVLASPYLNLVDEVIQLIRQLTVDERQLEERKGERLRLVFAAMTANSFYNSPGLSKYIPRFYVSLAERFLRKLGLPQSQAQAQQKAVQHLSPSVAVYEYDRQGWTFHAKGLWHLVPPQRDPTQTEPESRTCNLTLLGSSNFGYRSFVRDLELLCVMVTEERQLGDALSHEQARLFDTASRFQCSNYKREPFWFGVALPFVRRFL